MNDILLGSEVKDQITGFHGVAVARTEWLHGCVRITIQPPVDRDGKLPVAETFDLQGIACVTPATQATPSTIGGPQNDAVALRRR